MKAQSIKTCQFCATEIPEAAIVCPQCRRDVLPAASDQSHDPFAQQHTPILEKKVSGITFAGYLGILLGVLLVYAGAVISAQARSDAA
ncbi:MAG TPA: hypothetical protein VKE51_16590 [Vicinamibacterales bacterium]|nr:hypothetical protein [Vicinamibacterales bacterium]